MKRLFSFLIFSMVSLFALSLAASETCLIPLEDYKKNSSLQWTWALDCLQRNPQTNQQTILDIGCGDGKITAYIADFFSDTQVVGIDFSQKAIDFCEKNFPSSEHPNLSFQCKNVHNLEAQEQYDTVFCFCTMHWIKNVSKALIKVNQVLKPGGKFAFFVPAPNPYNLATAGKFLEKTDHWKQYFTDFHDPRHYYSKEEYMSMLSDAGFDIEYTILDDQYDYFPTYEAVVDWYKAICMQAQHLPTPELQAAFIKELMYYIEPGIQRAQDGGYFIVGPKLEIGAIKK